MIDVKKIDAKMVKALIRMIGYSLKDVDDFSELTGEEQAIIGSDDMFRRMKEFGAIHEV